MEGMKRFFLVAMPLFALLPALALADGKVYTFLGGRPGKLETCIKQGRLTVHTLGDNGSRSVDEAVKRTQANETIVVAAHSDGSIYASQFIQMVKEKNAQAKIRYVNFEGFRPNGGGNKRGKSRVVAGMPGVNITCVTMEGAPNYGPLTMGPGIKQAGCPALVVPPPSGKCDSGCRHYDVLSCDLLK